MRIFILIIVTVLLFLSVVVFAQDQRKVWGNVELNAGFITGKTFQQADSTANLSPDYNSVQLNLDYWFSENILTGATWEVGFNPAAGADSLGYTSLGVQFLWMFNPRIHLVLNPQYAILEMNGFNSFINFLGGFRIWINPDLVYLKVAAITVDGKKPIFIAGLAFRVN